MLPSVPLDRILPPQHRALAAEFLRFGVVGAAGFAVDTAVLYAALGLGAGLYGGRVLSYLAAATATWAMNRAWTFRAAAGPRGRAAMGRQWALFLLVNLVGFAMNYGAYALLVGNLPLAAAHPVLGVAAGALAGMGGNFLLSRRYVFQNR
ncbi:Putative flippase GtrA (transmembrane translocase of bactoprenol-linked glucose) [Roseomonas rosea]|uniref:Putative flippase GtrA (Transmembrane translocase of bactoprenol-linked glucose) n=1 Tax=Muricoccus roseus TaxID=198092 RepID=A0A1M6JFG9_9PROT|nr:GtrA family protein [Roseomonas rosea]SHJ45456.1 Putative flippase GtrA (transmembrane translocase of bactoprenol-linked glucose) [Roseomonas rosea]